MKKGFGMWMLLCTLCAFTACSDDDDKLPIEGLHIPSFTVPVKPGESVTIEGQGFTKASEIWFRALATRAENSADVKATVTEVTASGITFTTPLVFGQQTVLLKEAGEEYTLGEMTFEEKTGGGEGVTILPKKITEIVLTDSKNKKKTFLYTYDSKGRVLTITTASEGNQTPSVRNFTYTDSKITIAKENNEPTVIELKNGCAISSIEYEGEKYNIQKSYDYSGNYLSKLIKKEVNIDVNDNSWQKLISDSLIFVVKDSNLQNIDYYYLNENKKAKDMMSFEINNDRYNNTNLDLYGLIINEDAILLGLTGIRYKNMPLKITEINELEYQNNVTTYSYKVDKGYITEMTEDRGNNQIFVYTISYEE